MRQDFVANVSHELRTPLTVIMGYLEALADETDPATLRALLTRLDPPTKRMKVLVDDLLLLTRLESNQPPKVSDLEIFDMKPIFNAVIADARQLSGGEHALTTDIDGRLRLRGVERELHSMLANLIGNAVRYSPNGGEIAIRWRTKDGGARLEVEDHGIGLPQSGIASSRGTGMIAMRERAELLHGRIEYLKGPGDRGTLVRLDIPISEVAAHAK
jgi:two-component system phosphate regulon sensor histidine kinase PhoR